MFLFSEQVDFLLDAINERIAQGLVSGWSISRILSSELLRLCSHLSGRRVSAPLDAADPGLALSTRGKSACGDEQSPVVHRRLRPCLALLPTGVT